MAMQPPLKDWHSGKEGLALDCRQDEELASPLAT